MLVPRTLLGEDVSAPAQPAHRLLKPEMILPVRKGDANFDDCRRELLSASPNRGSELQRVAVFQRVEAVPGDGISVQERAVEGGEVYDLHLLTGC